MVFSEQKEQQQYLEKVKMQQNLEQHSTNGGFNLQRLYFNPNPTVDSGQSIGKSKILSQFYNSPSDERSITPLNKGKFCYGNLSNNEGSRLKSKQNKTTLNNDSKHRKTENSDYLGHHQTKINDSTNTTDISSKYNKDAVEKQNWKTYNGHWEIKTENSESLNKTIPNTEMDFNAIGDGDIDIDVDADVDENSNPVIDDTEKWENEERIDRILKLVEEDEKPQQENAICQLFNGDKYEESNYNSMNYSYNEDYSNYDKNMVLTDNGNRYNYYVFFILLVTLAVLTFLRTTNFILKITKSYFDNILKRCWNWSRGFLGGQRQQDANIIFILIGIPLMILLLIGYSGLSILYFANRGLLSQVPDSLLKKFNFRKIRYLDKYPINLNIN